MAYPAGVITRAVTFGPAFELEDGDVAGMTVAFKATRPGVLWMATGSPAVSTAITRNADDGVEQTVYLPVTDQAGWGDGDGNAIVPGEDGHVFLYSVSVIFTQNGRTIAGSQPRSKTIAIPAGDLSPIDLDKIVPLTSPGGTVVSVPDIWSGQLEAAQAAAEAAEAAIINSDTFMASKAADPTSQFAASLSAKIETVGATKFATLAPLPSGDATGVTDRQRLAALAADIGPFGKIIRLQYGQYVIDQPLPIRSGLVWEGITDVVTTIKIANGANCDAFLSDDFATLTLSGSPGGPSRWAVRRLAIEGNRANNTGGCGIRAFGFAYNISELTIRNCATAGMYTEWSFVDAGADGMESMFSSIRIHSSGGWGWKHRGPHDSVASQMIVFGNNLDGGNCGGIWLQNDNVNTPQRWLAGGQHFTDVHVWGTTHKWAIVADAGCYIVNSQFEGASVGQVLCMAAVHIKGGKVFNISNNGRKPNIGIQLGDDGSTPGYDDTRVWTVGGVNIETQLQGFYGASRESAPLLWLGANASKVRAQAAMVSAPGATAIDSGAVGTQLGSLSSLTVASAAAFPLSGRILAPVTGGIVTLAYSGISGNTLTGVTRVSGNATDTLVAGNVNLVVQAVWGTYDKQSDVSVRATHGSASPIERSNMSAESSPLKRRGYGGASGAVQTIITDAAIGHLEFPGTVSPLTVTPHANLGTGGTATSGGNDMRGQVAITAGSASISAGTMATLTMANPFEVNNPTVVVSGASAATALLNPYATSTGRGTFIIGFQTAPAAGSQHYVNFVVLG